jgi:thiol:disulfide interchange protein DsbG
MVGFLKPTSLGRAAAILSAADPARALATDEQSFDVATEEGGIAVPVVIPPAVRAAVVANTRLLAASGAEATPTLLFRDHAGAWKIMHHGPPEGLAAWLAGKR